MIRFKDIRIPKPCSVDYDSLPGNHVKRFCGSCEKHVYDFRGKDEAYLNEVFRKTGKLCGIYDKDKINTSYKPSLFQSSLNKLFALGLLFKTLTIQAESNTKETSIHISEVSFQKDTIPAIKTTIKAKEGNRFGYHISIYIDDVLYKSHAKIYNEHLYLPDSLTDDQVIKVIVHRSNFFRKKLRIKPRTYTFKVKDADKANVKIIYKQYIITFQKRPSSNHTMGLMKK